MPSEAEWEYSCRAGSNSSFSFGENISAEIVNFSADIPYASAPKGLFRKKTIPVGSLAVANAFGLYDIHGNVFEWCLDVFHPNYNDAPTDGTAWQIPYNKFRILRGGSWKDTGDFVRASLRFYSEPQLRFNFIGFRVVVSDIDIK